MQAGQGVIHLELLAQIANDRPGHVHQVSIERQNEIDQQRFWAAQGWIIYRFSE